MTCEELIGAMCMCNHRQDLTHHHLLVLPQVKSAAVLLLLYISAGASDGWRKVSEAGSTLVTLHAMLSVASSWPASAPQQLPSSGVAVLPDRAAETAQSVAPDTTASLQFVGACNALLYNLNQVPDSDEDVSPELSLYSHSFSRHATILSALIASAFGTCPWEPGQQPTANSGSPLARVQQWWRWRSALVAGCVFFFHSCSIHAHLYSVPELGPGDMLCLADNIRKQQQAAVGIIEASDASGVEAVIQLLTQAVIKVEDGHYVAVGQQIERDVLIRSLLLRCQQPQAYHLMTFFAVNSVLALDVPLWMYFEPFSNLCCCIYCSYFARQQVVGQPHCTGANVVLPSMVHTHFNTSSRATSHNALTVPVWSHTTCRCMAVSQLPESAL